MSDEGSRDVSTTEPKPPPPPLNTGPFARTDPGRRPVLKCRCGGLYLDADAHRAAFGHHPEPVAA